MERSPKHAGPVVAAADGRSRRRGRVTHRVLPAQAGRSGAHSTGFARHLGLPGAVRHTGLAGPLGLAGAAHFTPGRYDVHRAARDVHRTARDVHRACCAVAFVVHGRAEPCLARPDADRRAQSALRAPRPDLYARCDADRQHRADAAVCRS